DLEKQLMAPALLPLFALSLKRHLANTLIKRDIFNHYSPIIAKFCAEKRLDYPTNAIAKFVEALAHYHAFEEHFEKNAFLESLDESFLIEQAPMIDVFVEHLENKKLPSYASTR
ncbi:MAG TPA: hypothetical protein VFP93_00125, partial [Gammaproteobacteria bacterium]|nr:hypothetical protein [Gammaproteobacteria bacterium]